MGSTRAFQVLLRIKNTYNPDMLFLVETKTNHVRIEFVRVKLGYSSKLVVDSNGSKGGLCLLWSDSVDVNIIYILTI